MKELEFMELLGDLPAEYIDAASNPRQKKRRFAWLRYGVPAMAACIAVVIFAAVYPRLKSPEIPSVGTEPSVTVMTVTGDFSGEAGTTALPETDENGDTKEPVHAQTASSGETQTLTQSEAEKPQKGEESGTEHEGQGSAHHGQPDTPQEGTEKSGSHAVTTAKNGATKQTTKATTRSQAAGTTKATTRAAAGTIKATTRAAAGTTRVTTRAAAGTAIATSRAAAFTTARTTRTAPRTTVGTKRTTTEWEKGAMTSPTTRAMASYTEAGPDYTTPAYTQAPTSGNTPPEEHTDTPTVTDPEPISGVDLPGEVTKWQTYNPDPRSDDLDVWYEIASGYPGGDEYRQIEDFDFDSYNCLIIHLRTHATDADLTEITLDGRSLQISGMIYRQEFDPTQRHFMFAFAVPKNLDWLDGDPEYNWDLTGDASNFYMTTEGEPYFWYS